MLSNMNWWSKEIRAAGAAGTGFAASAGTAGLAAGAGFAGSAGFAAAGFAATGLILGVSSLKRPDVVLDQSTGPGRKEK